MSRADIARLADLLEADAGSTAVADAPEEDRSLALLASALREAAPPVPTIRDEFRAELRERLVAEARVTSPSRPLLTRLRDGIEQAKYSTGVATGTGIAAVALSGGAAGAAESAQPGDLLYPLKVELEDARLALTFDEVARGDRAISYAFDRVDEARSAIADGRTDDADEALHGAADRVDDAEEAFVASDQVDAALAGGDRLEELAAEVAALGLDSDASDGLLDTIEGAMEALAGVVLPGDRPDAPGSLPELDVPTVVPDPAATPDPTPTRTPAPTPTPGADEPGLDLPDVDLPSTLPTRPQLPDVDLPDVEIPLPGGGSISTPPSTGGVVEDAVDAVEDTVNGVGGVVDDVLTDPVGTVQDVVTDPVGTVGGVVDDVTAPLDDTPLAPVTDTVDAVVDTLDGATQPVDDLLDGVVGGGDGDTGGLIPGILGGN